MILQFLILLAGLALILFGANWLVDGSSSIAKKTGMSEFIIGLTIVGIGTSTPEMVVSFISSLQGKADMAIGNIVGSNIFNLLVVIGACAVIFPAKSDEDILKRDLWWNIGVSVLLFVLILNGSISRAEGIILLAVFIFYLGLMVRSAMKNRIQ